MLMPGVLFLQTDCVAVVCISDIFILLQLLGLVLQTWNLLSQGICCRYLTMDLRLLSKHILGTIKCIDHLPGQGSKNFCSPLPPLLRGNVVLSITDLEWWDRCLVNKTSVDLYIFSRSVPGHFITSLVYVSIAYVFNVSKLFFSGFYNSYYSL